jgi:sec-independent protein translocase protein TatA
MFSMSHWLIIIIVVLIVFGAGRLPRMMGDIGKGIKSLKEGLHGRDEDTAMIEDKEGEIIEVKKQPKGKKKSV